MQRTVRVALTGSSGQIGYSILPRIAAGDVFGKDTKVILQLFEITPAMQALEGVVMELLDGAYPLLEDVKTSDNPEVAFDGANWALLIGSKPRSKGMERGDLIRENGPIFVGQGKAMAKAADDIRVLVVGNPANTNALIGMHNSDIPHERWHAMTRLDENRAKAQLAIKASVPVSKVTNMTIWGNHSATQYPDTENAQIDGKPAQDVISHIEWLQGEFITKVQKRGAEIIAARGLSSAASAANAAIDHVKSFESATPTGDWFSAAVPSDGSYGIDKGLLFSFPLRSDGNGNWEIVQGLPMSDFAKEKVEATKKELLEEKSVVSDLLG
ncbi:MAG: malate dehydrogenase [Ectothiorhodospiraceae bacterium]|nr:malate dehydrogenase [Ectothiorhodospiraceae bacterium]